MKTVCISLSLLLLLFLYGCSSVSDADELDQYKIAFLDGLHIYTANLDGSDQTKIHELPEIPSTIVWSPNAERLATDVNMADFMTMTPNGNDLRQYDIPRTWFYGWLNEEKLLFTQSDTVYSMNIYSGNIEDLFLGRGPALSPDGNRMAVRMSFRNEPIPYNELHLVNLDGTNREKITDNVSVRSNAYAWSPDGSKIAFLRDHQIWKIDLESGIEQKLNPTSDLIFSIDGWSPDGSWILSSYRGTTQVPPIVISSDGSTYHKLPDNYSDPKWLPNPHSNQLVVESTEENTLKIIQADGSRSRTIVNLAFRSFGIFDISPRPVR